MDTVFSDEFPSPQTWWNHIVSYGETDGMRVVYYGNYLHWFEQARSHFLRELGHSYLEIEKKGIMLPVVEAHVRYLRPARYEDRITVRTGIGDWGRASLTFMYEIYLIPLEKQEGQILLTTGWTRHACVNPIGRPVKVPLWLKEMVGAYTDAR